MVSMLMSFLFSVRDEKIEYLEIATVASDNTEDDDDMEDDPL